MQGLLPTPGKYQVKMVLQMDKKKPEVSTLTLCLDAKALSSQSDTGGNCKVRIISDTPQKAKAETICVVDGEKSTNVVQLWWEGKIYRSESIGLIAGSKMKTSSEHIRLGDCE